jgi:CRP-like cAMP-binding protein
MDSNLVDSLCKLAEPFLTPPGQRSETHLVQIEESMKNFKFFKAIESKDLLKGLLQYLTLEVFEPCEKIANFGEIVDKCLFIIYGSLNVMTPELNSPMNMSQKEVKETLTRQTTFLRRNSINIINIKDTLIKIKSMIGTRSPVRRGSVKVDTEFVRKLSKLSDFKSNSMIGAYESFAENNLVEGKPCASYVEAKGICICASLTREDFRKAMQEEEERKNVEKAEFLHEIPIFYQVSKNSLLKLASFFQVLKYTKNQIVYREDMPVDMIYFVHSGDFQVSKCQDSITKKIIEIPKGFLSSQKSLLKVDNAREVKMTHQIQVAIRGKYEVLGYDEYYSGQALRNHSCKCISVIGVLFAIKTSVTKT